MTFSTLHRTFVTYSVTDFDTIKQQMLSWASRFNICCFLDNHHYELPLHTVECLCGVGAVDILQTGASVPGAATMAASGNSAMSGRLRMAGNGRSTDGSDDGALAQLEAFAMRHKGEWLFGHLGYGLSEETEPLGNRVARSGPTDPGKAVVLPDAIGFPDLFFFVPAVVVELQQDQIRIGAVDRDPAAVYAAICSETFPGVRAQPVTQPVFRPRFSRDEYVRTVEALRQHILRGDCYEINFCQEFYANATEIDPLRTWLALGEVSPNPFSAFYRLDDRYLLCASPERYLRKSGSLLSSQPIKGTSPRHPADPAADKASRETLFSSAKDRSENVMVVDLVRNDLSRICLPGTVHVEELYGIYGFPQVFQMISTIQGEMPPLSSAKGLADAIRASFPMGSMTGAPKKRVVELIRQYERTRRGIFSGAVGYMRPDGDFDFNVVIRSLLYNHTRKYLSYLVGSGITFYSDPQLEYEECMVKAEGMKRALGVK